MLDSLDPPHTTVAPEIEPSAWQPDPVCLAALDEYVVRAARCGAAAGLGNAAIAERITDLIADLWPEPPPAGRDPDPALAGLFTSHHPSAPPDRGRWRAEQAAIALARCCAATGEPARRIIARLSSLATIHGWPDPEAIVGIIAAAIEECWS